MSTDGINILHLGNNSSQLLQAGLDLVMQYGPKLLAAIVIFYVGKLLAKWLKRLVTRMMNKGNVDPLIVSFTSSLVYMAMMVFVVVATLGQVWQLVLLCKVLWLTLQRDSC